MTLKVVVRGLTMSAALGCTVEYRRPSSMLGGHVNQQGSILHEAVGLANMR